MFYTRKGRATPGNLHLLSSTAVTHCLLIDTHFADLRKDDSLCQVQECHQELNLGRCRQRRMCYNKPTCSRPMHIQFHFRQTCDVSHVKKITTNSNMVKTVNTVNKVNHGQHSHHGQDGQHSKQGQTRSTQPSGSIRSTWWRMSLEFHCPCAMCILVKRHFNDTVISSVVILID